MSLPVNLNPVYKVETPIHDAILPLEFEGVIWAIPNLGDNVETENASMAELFEIVNRSLLAMSLMRDCFTTSPPSVEFVKNHHNLYVRLNSIIDARTKKDNQARLEITHITPTRRVFNITPVRYFDQKNRWTKRWTELCLYGLSAFAQMSEANTWPNDFHEVSAKLMKKPFQEAYRLMAVELFNIPLATADSPDFRLKPEDFANYNPSAFIPAFEFIEHPFTAFLTEDRIRVLSTPSVPVSEGLVEDKVSPGEQQELDVRNQIIQ